MGDLTIRILEATNLIPSDRNGKSDPYVTVEILEDPMQKKQKTHTHHKVSRYDYFVFDYTCINLKYDI